MNLLPVFAILMATSTGIPQNALLEFSAEWCGPCRQMSSVVSRMQRQGCPILKIDIDSESNLSRRFGVSSVPTFVLVRDGKEVERVVGSTSESELRRLLDRLPRKTAASGAPADQAPSVKVVPPLKAAVAIESDSPDLRVRSDQPRRRFLTLGAAQPNSKEPGQPPTPVTLAAHDTPQSGSRFSIPFMSRKKPETAFTDTPVIRAKHEDVAETHGEASANPLAFCTRIRVKDQRGTNYGSGTIVDSRVGRTLVLSCGHLFRELSPDATIEVDVFVGNRFETFIGRVVGFDLDADVGLVAFPTSERLPATHIAAANSRLETDSQVVSVGCSGGESPSRQVLQITAINRYQGPDNIECTGIPVQGRSGGGLFDPTGEVIGVCIAADPRDRRGLYAGLPPIHNLLDQHGLSHLYRTAERREHVAPVQTEPVAEPAPQSALQPTVARNDSPVSTEWIGTPEVLRSEATLPLDLSGRSDPAAAAQPAPFPAEALAAATQDSQRPPSAQFETSAPSLEQLGDAEVICIIRPVGQPRAASRVVIINRATSKFLADLTGEFEELEQAPTSTARATRDVPFGIGSRPNENRPSPNLQSTSRHEPTQPPQSAADHPPTRYQRSPSR